MVPSSSIRRLDPRARPPTARSLSRDAVPVDVIWVPDIGEGRMPGSGIGFGVEEIFGEPDWERTTFLLRKDIFVFVGKFVGWV